MVNPIFLTFLALVPQGSATDPDDPCFLLNWDTVTGISFIQSLSSSHEAWSAKGQCEYEVDTEAGPGGSYLEINVPPTTATHEVFEVGLIIYPGNLNPKEGGHFRFLSVLGGPLGEPMFNLDLDWPTMRGSIFGPLKVNAVLNPTNNTHLKDPSAAAIVEHHSVHDGFVSWIDLRVVFYQSSGPSIPDGSVEIWVNGFLETTVKKMVLDWSTGTGPSAVQFGVIDVFDPNTTGKLRFIPLGPTPYDPPL